MWGCYCVMDEIKVCVFVPRHSPEDAKESFDELSSVMDNLISYKTSAKLGDVMQKDVNHIRLSELCVMSSIIEDVYKLNCIDYASTFIFIEYIAMNNIEPPRFINEDEITNDKYKDYKEWG